MVESTNQQMRLSLNLNGHFLVKNIILSNDHFDTKADVPHRYKYALFDYKYYQLIE